MSGRWWLLALLALNSAHGAEPAPSSDALRAVPPELLALLRENVDSEAEPAQRLRQLVDFTSPNGALSLHYDEEATFTPSEAFAQRRVNCVSYTLLFIALAKTLDLPAFAQEVPAALSWRQEGNTVFRYTHVNVGLRLGPYLYEIDVAGSAVLSARRAEAIDEQRLHAHYYNSLAMQRLAAKDFDAAQALVATSLQLDPRYAAHWSNAGVIAHLRGDLDTAAQRYRKALSYDRRHHSALFNLIGLSERRGEFNFAAKLRERLTRVRSRDPLYHFLQGQLDEQNGESAAAIAGYRRAIKLLPREHRFHAALARVYWRDGDHERALRALRRAEALSRGAPQLGYRQQIEALRRVERSSS